jgi:hypothetical protein
VLKPQGAGGGVATGVPELELDELVEVVEGIKLELEELWQVSGKVGHIPTCWQD